MQKVKSLPVLPEGFFAAMKCLEDILILPAKAIEKCEY